MPLVPAKKQKTPTCIREIQVHKLWTKVYSQQGLTGVSIFTISVVLDLETMLPLFGIFNVRTDIDARVQLHTGAAQTL